MSLLGEEQRATMRERGIWIPDPAQRSDLSVFTDRALRLDGAAMVRLCNRADGTLAAWVSTGLDVLACRVVTGWTRPVDLTCAADQLARGLRDADASGYVDPGLSMDASWRSGLPPKSGFAHLDDVPASVLAELARRGTDLAKEHGGAHGPPASLLDQQVLQVGSSSTRVGVPMRCVFSLTAMGFVPDPTPANEVVRVRSTPVWLRIDARFGSVYRRLGSSTLVLG